MRKKEQKVSEVGYRLKRGRPDRHAARAKKRTQYLKKQGVLSAKAKITGWNPNDRYKKRYIE